MTKLRIYNQAIKRTNNSLFIKVRESWLNIVNIGIYRWQKYKSVILEQKTHTYVTRLHLFRQQIFYDMLENNFRD